MSELKHCHECVEHNKLLRELRAAFADLWPDFCRYCDGWSGWWSPPNREDPGDFSPCRHCYEQGLCPRCSTPSQAILDGDDAPCPFCGWTSAAPGAPPSSDCDCLLYEDDQIYGDPFREEGSLYEEEELSDGE